MNNRRNLFLTVLAGIAFIFVVTSLFFDNLLLSWLIVAAAIVYSLYMTLKYGSNWWKGRKIRVAQRERFLFFLVSLMALFLALGTAWHLCAFQIEYEESVHDVPRNRFLFVNAEFLLRSLLCSLQLFAANIDSNVFDDIKGHEYVKGLISIQAVLSFSCTIAILISLVYARVKAYFKLHKSTLINEQYNHLYVFFGINEPSRLLAKDIRAKDCSAQILFVENSSVDKEDHGGWDSIVGMFTHRKETFATVDELNARVTFTETRLNDIEIEEADANFERIDIFSEVNLLKLKDLILKLRPYGKKSQLHIFFLSKNEDENIQAISVLARDATVLSNSDITQKLYCHARQNGLNRVIENMAVKRGLDVRIIDSSHLSVELLKADPSNHPVRLVELDEENPTTVKSPLNCLIIGFDEAGQDAMKFLYEYGAFVSNTGTPNKEVRSTFHCLAIDKRMDELEGVFTTFAPAAMAQKNSDGSSLIELRKCDCMSGEFYEDVLNEAMRKNLNYIVITVGDDDFGMLLAIRIMNHIRRDRDDLSKLRIYVRSYRSDRESYMQKIANYYNEGYNQDQNKGLKALPVIIPFGQSEKIYSYDMIIREELLTQGKIYQKMYCEMKGEKELWDLRRELLTGAKKKDNNRRDENGDKLIYDVPIGERVVSLNDMRSLRRKESQDLSNSLHKETKIYLLRNALGSVADWQDFVNRYFKDDAKPDRSGSYDKIVYPNLTEKENQAILNLARLEHLRWNASHEMLGYSKCNDRHSCDERTRKHNCLRPWEELDNESKTVTEQEGWTCDYKAFDFAVVDVSVWLDKDIH